MFTRAAHFFMNHVYRGSAHFMNHVHRGSILFMIHALKNPPGLISRSRLFPPDFSTEFLFAVLSSHACYVPVKLLNHDSTAVIISMQITVSEISHGHLFPFSCTSAEFDPDVFFGRFFFPSQFRYQDSLQNEERKNQVT
jgi:hypothetical protein